ncbi:TetR/AcrR family transcriptional regulator [Clostridium tagluense]|uniref:TetR/AcrR family transcriptional regulator n=1 Tax=Clostridium tagluense TaxID=360422 RepID=UPI001CF4E552|nr:helix-turn-helix domain-containing protein [Clostridium tagluense]MCB2311432.1 TetR/AcrR family transcriptional regulator [Clostridium tagluense]MCB2316156.1 TetR/AcrR family transcriptional regulator [Clostridium tagluense]MCB2321040.1 TetR/AcrR family transcriptional regulator [Clostridium tagluense]MCB2326057.1 TetR/AcrR family transcriptional regulator [Clostridium tagluense]MCB2330780.1 TetR/AcrR family transcriptional regulator [Clostridium tagluense]
MDIINKSDFIENFEGKVPGKIGRPVDKRRDIAILKAALDLVAEQGYECVTMDSIALRAHAGKATLYRRWKSKPYLIAEAIRFMMPCEQKVDMERCENNLRDYLCESLSIYFGIKDEVRQKVMLSIATAISRDKLLSEAINLDCITDQTCIFSDAIECAINKKLNKEQLKLLADVGPALLFYQLIITGKPIKMSYVEHIVDNLIIPLIELNKK